MLSKVTVRKSFVHLRHCVTPPPAEDMELQVSAPLIQLCHTGEGDCVAILICHCETPLRRCGNLNRTRGCNPLFNKESMGLLRSLYSLAKTLRHSLEDRNPILLSVSWIPAFAGMTIRGVLQRSRLLK